MKAAHVLLCTAVLSMPAYADTYLCIGEQVGSVGDKNGEILTAESQLTSDKFLVSEHGVQVFGTEEWPFDHCDMNNGRPG